MQREKKKPVIGKRFMPGSLEKMIINYPMKPAGKEEMERGATSTSTKCLQLQGAVLLIIVFCATFAFTLVKRDPLPLLITNTCCVPFCTWCQLW